MGAPSLLSVLAYWTLFIGQGVTSTGDVPVQRHDGWYNNPMNPEWGGVGRPLERNVTPTYEDETYRPSGWDRPNPRTISNEIFGSPDAGVSGLRNERNLTAMLAFFGLVVQHEILDTDEVTCPIEILKTPVPRGDPDFDPEEEGDETLPYERAAYDKNTGQSPNNPRRQLNYATSFIDGSFLYGNSLVRSEYLRLEKSAKLACEDKWEKFPVNNEVNLPYHPYSFKYNRSEQLWRMGDSHAFESPGILALGVMFFRYHNKMVDKVKEESPVANQSMSVDELFYKSRRRVIATLQNIIAYEWLPKLINRELPPYTGYKPWIKSDITDLFDAGAINYIMTLIPSAVTHIDKVCKLQRHGQYIARRLCNTYWKAMDVVYEREDGTLEILKGLSAQLAEKDDTYVAEDFRSKYYGPVYHTTNDAVVLTIMKGRDYGLPDYNTVRKTLGLPQVNSFEEINPELNRTNPQVKWSPRVASKINQ
ncbi:hypothetical protein Btru_057458 [Bulinus truncatus]|nr:hypothetical protein Btru_057458 [Bulinus truncatus]